MPISSGKLRCWRLAYPRINRSLMGTSEQLLPLLMCFFESMAGFIPGTPLGLANNSKRWLDDLGHSRLQLNASSTGCAIMQVQANATRTSYSYML